MTVPEQHPPPSSSLVPPQLPPPPSSSLGLVDGGAACPTPDPGDNSHDTPVMPADMPRDLVDDLITMSDDDWPSRPLLEYMHQAYLEGEQGATAPPAPMSRAAVLLSPRRLRSGNPPASVARQPAGPAAATADVEDQPVVKQKRVK